MLQVTMERIEMRSRLQVIREQIEIVSVAAFFLGPDVADTKRPEAAGLATNMYIHSCRPEAKSRADQFMLRALARL